MALELPAPEGPATSLTSYSSQIDRRGRRHAQMQRTFLYMLTIGTLGHLYKLVTSNQRRIGFQLAEIGSTVPAFIGRLGSAGDTAFRIAGF